MTEKPEKAPTDWEAIEKEYRAGQLSEAQIARQYNISRAAIQKRAKKNGWNRDLSEKVRTEVAARLVAEGLQNHGGLQPSRWRPNEVSLSSYRTALIFSRTAQR